MSRDIRNLETPNEVVLLPYQRKWVEDQSQFKIGLWARQTGKDYSCAAEAAIDCVRNPGSHWLIIAAGERQAVESFDKACLWARINEYFLKHATAVLDRAQATVKGSEILWGNGSRLTALPAKPETVRGYSANVILTEFAFHEDTHELWRAIYPTITNPLRGGPKKLRIVSTPNGRGNMFYDLWHGAAEYSRHKITIHDAIAQGLQLDVEKLRAGFGDAEGWLQEYECEFLDGASALFPQELLATCEHAEAARNMPHPPSGATVLGIDFGRKRDLTVCWTLNVRGSELWTTEILELENVSTPDQIELLRPRLQRAHYAALDYTGPGIGLGDFLALDFGQSNANGSGGKIELCTFTQSLKNEIFSKLRLAFEQRRLRIPACDAVREDLQAMQRVTLANGSMTYRAVGAPDGHCDRATALALAFRASRNLLTKPCEWESIERSRSRYD